MNGFTLDAGGLIAVDRNDRRVTGLIARCLEHGKRLTVPSTVLAQVLRNPARQARLSRLLWDESTDLVSLNRRDAVAVGILLAKTGTKDIVDAHVVICAQRTGQAVITSDPDDLKRIDPELELIEV